MNTSTVQPNPYRWNPASPVGKESEVRQQAARVVSSVTQMRDFFVSQDDQVADIDQQQQRVWLKDAPFGQLRVSGSLNKEEGLSSYLGDSLSGLPDVHFSLRTEVDNSSTYVKRTQDTIEQVRSLPSGEMEYLFARTPS